jgi:lipid-binding SYLF domain-containing protein
LFYDSIERNISMKNTIQSAIILLLLSSVSVYAQKFDVEESNKTIAEFKEVDPEIRDLFDSSYGYAVLYSVGKGGIGVGGARGKGTVYKGGTPVADVRMTQVTVGFQLGGQKYAEVIFFENKESYDRFVGNAYEFSAQVSAVALKEGASADAEYRDGVLVFTMAIGGLMYEASIGGQKFNTEMF